jgi:hypothetical protein
MTKKIDAKMRAKCPEGPNHRYGLNMLKRSFRQNGIKAWDNMDR